MRSLYTLCADDQHTLHLKLCMISVRHYHQQILVTDTYNASLKTKMHWMQHAICQPQLVTIQAV